jgi:hypothetical protein
MTFDAIPFAVVGGFAEDNATCPRAFNLWTGEADMLSYGFCPPALLMPVGSFGQKTNVLNTVFVRVQECVWSDRIAPMRTPSDNSSHIVYRNCLRDCASKRTDIRNRIGRRHDLLPFFK